MRGRRRHLVPNPNASESEDLRSHVWRLLAAPPAQTPIGACPVALPTPAMVATTSLARAPAARPFAPAAAAPQLLQRGAAAAQPRQQQQQQQQQRHPIAAAAQAREAETIENLNTDYCDEFECTSSPAVEATVRATARALGRGAAGPTRGFLSRNVEYQDSFRRFKGPDGYASLTFVQDAVAAPRVQVTRMRMVDNSSALINWRLTGSIGPFQLAVEGETFLALNVLTGQIDKHT